MAWTAADLSSHPDVVDAAAVVGRSGRAVPVASILSTERPWVTVSAADDGYRASIPTEDLSRGGYLLVASEDGPLSEGDGGPIRLLVAAGATLCWNVKRVTSLRATLDPEPDSVPADPPH